MPAASGVPLPPYPGKRTPVGKGAGANWDLLHPVDHFSAELGRRSRLGAEVRTCPVARPGAAGTSARPVCGAAPAMEQGGSDAAHPHRASGSDRRARKRHRPRRLRAGRGRRSGPRSHRPELHVGRRSGGFRLSGCGQRRQEEKEERQEEVDRRFVEVLEEEEQEEAGVQGRLGHSTRPMPAVRPGSLGTAPRRLRSLGTAPRRLRPIRSSVRRLRSIRSSVRRLRSIRSSVRRVRRFLCSTVRRVRSDNTTVRRPLDTAL